MSTIGPESDDALEAELAALRPVALTPAVVSHIAEAVQSGTIERTRPAAGRSRARLFIGALATGLAASVAVTAFVRPAKHGRHDEFATTGPGSGLVSPALAPPAQAITLGEYRSALARSPEDALALLDRVTTASAPRASPRAFDRTALAASDRGESSTP